MSRSLVLRSLAGNRSVIFAYFGALVLFAATSAIS
jgi:hypothetical protein